MAKRSDRGQCLVEAAVILAVLAAVLLTLYSLADASRKAFGPAVLSKEVR